LNTHYHEGIKDGRIEFARSKAQNKMYWAFVTEVVEVVKLMKKVYTKDDLHVLFKHVAYREYKKKSTTKLTTLEFSGFILHCFVLLSEMEIDVDKIKFRIDG